MTEEKEIKYFADPQSSGLNGDDADFTLPTNQVVNGENVRWGSTDKGATSWVESVGSTELLSSPQPSVTFITIGSAVDNARNRLFYFLYNKFTPDHKIVCYDLDAETFYDVLLSTQVTGGLNFNKDYPIHSARVVGNLLYWTDNYSNPKRINVDAAIKLNNPSYVTDEEAYVSPVEQSVITIIRRPPAIPLSVSFDNDPTKEFFLADFAGQFAYRYVYRDGETSVFSVPTEIVNYRYNYSGNLQNAFNVIVVELNLPATNGEYIIQDVQKIQYAVRFNNNPNYFVVKEWDKDNSDDEAQIVAYNAGGASLTLRFFNDVSGIAVSTAESIKPFDSVPILSETLEIATNRLFLANNTVGYDTPSTTSLNATVTLTTASGIAPRIFKSYSSYQIALRFRDEYKRATAAVTSKRVGSNCFVQIPERGDFNDASFVEYISWTLSNANALVEIPEEAYYYDILITKNLRTRYFVQWMPNSIKYVVKNIDGTYTYQDTYNTGIYGIAFGTSFLYLQGAGISFTEGDMLRIYPNLSTPVPFSLAVIAQDADYIIARPIDLGPTSSLSTPYIVEYYTPYKLSGEEIYYTTGNSYRITAPGTSGRQYGTLSGNIAGDCFMTTRPFVFSTPYIECMSPNDDHPNDWFAIYGEVNIETTLGQETKLSSVKWSNTRIEGSNINGLSTFEPLNEKILPANMGALMKLQNTSKIEAQGGVMLVIGEDETASMYLGEVQTYGSDQRPEQVLAVDSVIGTVNILRGSFGTKNPESVVEYRGAVYWYDAQNGRVIQYSQNGLYPISNYKMTRFWKLFSDQYNSMTAAEIEALGDRPFVFMAVDPYHDELLISIPKLLNTPPKGYLPDYPSTIYPFDVWDGQGKTMVFDLKSDPNRWMPPHTFVTENFITLQNKLFSFKNGQLYLHNQTTSYNQFYGTQCKSKLMFVCNQQPNDIKVYNNISIQTNTGTLMPSLTYFYVDTPYQQATDLVDFDWTNLESILYATLYRNKLVPTATGYNTNGLLTAEKIRTNALKVMVQFDVTTVPVQLRFVTVGYINSVGHRQVKLG